MARLIDPPVTPYSPIEDLRAWVVQLEEMLRDADDDDRRHIELSLEDARRWVQLSEETTGGS